MKPKTFKEFHENIKRISEHYRGQQPHVHKARRNPALKAVVEGSMESVEESGEDSVE